MWKAKVTKKILRGISLVIQVEFVNGEKTYLTSFTNPVNLEKEIRNKIVELERIEQLEEDTAIGDVDLTEPVLEPPPPPTPEEIKKQEYQEALVVLQTKKFQLNLGLIEQSVYDTELNKVKLLGIAAKEL